MMFRIDLNKIGCGQKIQMRDLGVLSEEIGFDLSSDAGCSKIGETFVCSTIDRIGRMLNDVRGFCEIAISHAISDLLVSRGNPQCASVCIEYGPEFDSVEKMALLSRSLSDGFEAVGVELLNLHSVKSDYTYLTISVFGTREYSQTEFSHSGSVFISRRLGASKMAVLREIDDDVSLPFTTEIIEKRYLGGMHTDFVATDITGFGLAGAAINLCNRVGAVVQIELSNRHIIHEDVLGIPVGCFEADGLPADAFEATCRKARAVSLCTEFSGPTLFFVGTGSVADFVAEFLDLHGWKPLPIGTFTKEESRAGVKFSWND